MTTTQITMTIVAISLTSVALFGSYKYASAHSDSHGWRGGIMHQIHSISAEDWERPEKIAQYQEMCVQRSVEHVEKMIGYVESELNFLEEQSEPWSLLVATFQNEKTTVQLLCEKLLTRGNTENLPARLELLTTMVNTGQESLQRLIPAISDFYAVLDEQQRASVESMIAKHHGSHSMMHH